MAGSTLTTKVVVTNPQGLHLRPAAAFVKAAKQFLSAVYVVKDNERIDGKSVINLLTLGALEGTELMIEVCGTDAEEALPVLVKLVNEPAEEPNTPPAP